ncbi:MAG: carotenoid 1,2-hydratase [Sinobacteraceae bacterium]|nr:carotenoid 1,2-hydratase [Nevskiaceae bacterium]
MQYRHHPVASQTGPDFAASLPTNGYAWWYVDALSDCGRHGLTMIAMLGCVFSPWYAWARAGGRRQINPLEHSALNLALYGAAGHRWALTERGAADLVRSNGQLTIGRSSLHWDGTALHAEINEITSPWPTRLQGRLRLIPEALIGIDHVIDRDGAHRWYPIAPQARIEVEFSRPRLQWQGHAYFDANQGARPLEDDFHSWNWSRAALDDHARVYYDTAWRGGGGKSLALRFDGRGVHHCDPPPLQTLPCTPWGIERTTRCDAGAQASIYKTLENGPFYARSLVDTTVDGQPMRAFHESVSLDRFASRWVQTLLPVRLPRRPLQRGA